MNEWLNHRDSDISEVTQNLVLECLTVAEANTKANTIRDRLIQK